MTFMCAIRDNTMKTNSFLLRSLGTMICLAALMTTGCARLNSIHRGKSVPSDRGHILSIDAKQRAIISVPAHLASGQTEAAPIMRFCSEPPPDVFTAIATGYGIKALFGNEKTRQEIGAEIQQTISENAATIGKTQTVNILREMMFRNCERFLSGAASADEFIVQAARDQRAIVHVLAVEQLTGAARTQSAALTTLAKTAASGVSGESIQSLAKARGDVQTTQAAADKAKSEAAALPPIGACQTGKDAYKDSGASDDEIKAKNAACQASTKADADAKTAAEHYATIKKAVEKQEALSTEASGDAKAIASSAEAVSRHVADAVVEIVRMNNNFSELEMTCVVFLRTLKSLASSPDTVAMLSDGEDSFKSTCLKLLKAVGERDETRIDYERLMIEQDTVLIRDAVDEQISNALPKSQNVWEYIFSASGVDANALSKLEAKAGIRINSAVKKRILASKNLNEFNTAFAGLLKKHRTALSAAASP